MTRQNSSLDVGEGQTYFWIPHCIEHSQRPAHLSQLITIGEGVLEETFSKLRRLGKKI
jgi:hypothetical protein